MADYRGRLPTPAIHGIGVLEADNPNTPDFSVMPPPYPFKVPRLLRLTAKEMAGTFYDGMQRFQPNAVHASDNLNPVDYAAQRSALFRKTWKTSKLYVAWCWPMYVKDARALLATMLGNPATPEHQKEVIYECLREGYSQEAFLPHIAPAIRGLHG